MGRRYHNGTNCEGLQEKMKKLFMETKEMLKIRIGKYYVSFGKVIKESDDVDDLIKMIKKQLKVRSTKTVERDNSKK